MATIQGFPRKIMYCFPHIRRALIKNTVLTPPPLRGSPSYAVFGRKIFHPNRFQTNREIDQIHHCFQSKQHLFAQYSYTGINGRIQEPFMINKILDQTFFKYDNC